MASAADPETEVKCPICVQDYQETRKLPGCIHCFCENCILTFVLNLKKENKLGQEFECPVCRLPSPAPEEENVTVDWVRTMDLKTDLNNGTTNEVGDDDSEWCNHCKSVSKTVNSNIYCLNCHEYFCKPCSDTLHGFRLARNHRLVDLDDKRTDPLYTKALNLLHSTLVCSVHGDKPVEFHRKYSKKMFCSSCIAEVTSSETSRTILCLKDVIPASSETESTTLLETTTKLQKYIGEVTDVIKKNDHETEADLDKIVQEVNKTKEKVIHLFEVLENNIQTEGNAIKKEIAIENEDKLNDLQDTNRNLEIIRCILENFMDKMSPDQTFVCRNELKDTIKRLEKDIVQRNSSVKSRKITLQTSVMLETLKGLGPNETSQLASVCKTVTDIDLPSYNQHRKRFEQNGLHKIHKTKADFPTYNGVLFLSNGQCLLTDSYYGYYCLADEKKASVGSYSKPIPNMEKIESENNHFRHLRYASYIGNSILALSIPSIRNISFVTADREFSEKGEIQFARTPTAICGLNDGYIAISWRDPIAFGIISVNIAGSYKEHVYFTSDTSGRQLKSFDYISIDEDSQHVIQPCRVDKAVYCFDFDGQPIFKYTSTDLKSPKGVGVDYEGNIYVCNETGGIHVVSPEGQAICIIKEGCPEKPLAIGFSTDRKSFAVTEYEGSWSSVYFFSIVSE